MNLHNMETVVVLPATPVIGGGNVNFQRNQYQAPPAPLLNVERTLREILQPQRTTTNSCICLPEEANQFLMKSKMIRLLPVYQGVDPTPVSGVLGSI